MTREPGESWVEFQELDHEGRVLCQRVSYYFYQGPNSWFHTVANSPENARVKRDQWLVGKHSLCIEI